MIHEEKWKDVYGYEELYSISDMGNLLSKRKGLIMRPSNAGNGYSRVNLFKKTHENKNPTGAKIAYIHRLVANAFIPNPENLPWVNHKNGLKHDNRACNLEWTSIKDNHLHAYRTGLHVSVKGSKTGAAKINEQQAIEIFNSTDSRRKLVQIYGVSLTTIASIKNKTGWRHIHNAA